MITETRSAHRLSAQGADQRSIISDGTSPSSPNTDRVRPRDSTSTTVALTLLSCVTAIGFCRVFEGWSFLPTMLIAVFGTHLAAYALRLAHAPWWVAVPVTMLFLAALIGWRIYPTTMLGPFPTGATWDLFQTDLALAREQFPTAVPPVAALGGFFAGAVLATGIAAALSDAFAFRAFGRAEAVTPNAVLFVFASALGVDRNRVAVAALWLATALGVIALLRAIHAQAEFAWIGSQRRVIFNVAPVALGLALLAAAGAAYAGPKLPGADERGLIDTHRRTDVTQVLSPLVDIRSQLINLPNLEMFTVQASEPGYWRTTGLARFDGTTWGLPDDELRSTSPSLAPTTSAAHGVEQTITISSLGGPLLPAAYRVAGIDSPDVFWVEDAGSIVVPDAGLQQGDTYVVMSSLVDPTVEELRAASTTAPSPIDVQLPPDVPPEAITFAQQVTASAPTAYDKVRLLQDWFRTEFIYDLTVQRGHSNNAISNFLRVRRGYCEQFAGTFAAMARSLGIPARVAVGFTPGDLGSDGLYHVYGRNAHAWAEVFFDGIGWVPFDPTPGRGQPGQEDTTGAAVAQAAPSAGRGGAGGTNTPLSIPRGREDGQEPSFNSVNPGGDRDLNNATGNPSPSSGNGGIGWLLSRAFAVLLAVGVWMLVMPRLAAFVLRRREPKDSAAVVQQNWRRVQQGLQVIGLEHDPAATPREVARQAHAVTGVDQRSLDELADQATASFFGGVTTELAAQRSDSLTNIVLISVHERLTARQRILTRLNPRLALAVSPIRSTRMPVLADSPSR